MLNLHVSIHYTCLEDDFVHVVQVAKIFLDVAMVPIHMQDSRGGVASLSH